MIKNYLTISFRKFIRQKFFSLINLFGLSVGLASVALIMLYVVDELGYDRFHENSGRIYRAVENQYYAGQPVFPVAVTPVPLGPSLVGEYPSIELATRYWASHISVRKDGHHFEERGAYVDGSFLKVFSFEVMAGNASKALDGADNIVLTEAMAQKYFPHEDPIGKMLPVGDGREARVSGVIKNIPENSHLKFDFLMPFESVLARNPEASTEWGNNTLYTYVLVKPGTNMEDLNRQVKGQIKKNKEGSITEIYLQPLTDIHLGSVFFTADVGGKGNMQYVTIFLVVAVFILVIACINFMNLATARSMGRAREVGLRKSIGASRQQLVYQFLSESVITSLMAMALAILIVDLLLPRFNLLSGKSLSFDLLSNYPMLLYLIGFSIITGLMAGSYPAFYLSSFRPASVLRPGQASQPGGTFLRKVVQFSISTAMIVGTIMVYGQIGFIRSIDLGYTKDNVVKIPRISDDYPSFKNELLARTGIVNVSASNQHPAYVENSTSGIGWEGKNEEETILIHTLITDFDFLETMGMEMKLGRTFSRERHSDSLGVVLNEEAARVMGFKNPIGQKLEVGAPQPYTVIGVVRDFHFKSIHQKIEPLAMVIAFKPGILRYSMVRVGQGDPREALATIRQVWEKFNPGMEFSYTFLDEDFDKLYSAEERTGKLFEYFSGLAIVISCLGLFGLASYTMEQRTKEFGVRKVLGASILQLFSTASYGFVVLVCIAFVISISISWYFIDQWLNEFAYHVEMGYQAFLWAGLIAIAMALATVSYQAIKSARLNPMDSLRQE